MRRNRVWQKSISPMCLLTQRKTKKELGRYRMSLGVSAGRSQRRLRPARLRRTSTRYRSFAALRMTKWDAGDCFCKSGASGGAAHSCASLRRGWLRLAKNSVVRLAGRSLRPAEARNWRRGLSAVFGPRNRTRKMPTLSF